MAKRHIKVSAAGSKESLSELKVQLRKASPYLRAYVSELQKEIGRLQREHAKQEVAHLSAMEKLKAEQAEQLSKALIQVNVVAPKKELTELSDTELEAIARGNAQPGAPADAPASRSLRGCSLDRFAHSAPLSASV